MGNCLKFNIFSSNLFCFVKIIKNFIFIELCSNKSYYAQIFYKLIYIKIFKQIDLNMNNINQINQIYWIFSSKINVLKKIKTLFAILEQTR